MVIFSNEVDGPGSIPSSVKTDSETHLASYPVDIGDFFPGG
jgi:hypothetical protein